MSQLSREGLISQSNFLFPDNTQQDITPTDIRQFDLDVIDSFALTGSLVVSASHALFADDADDLILNVKNTSGADIGKGLAVHATGVTGENVNIELADSSNPSNMPAIGVTRDIITNNASGVIVISGKITGLSTSGLVAGEQIYVSTTGTLTTTKPTGTELIQNIGVCGKVDGTDGEIIVQGSGRSNDLPNILNGYAWVGDSNGVPQAVQTGSWDSQTVIPPGTISGSSQVDYPQISNIPSGIVSSSVVSSIVAGTNVTISPVGGTGAVTVNSTATTTLPAGVVSGSSQIDYPNISNIPSGIISGSEQLPGGLVSGSGQITDGSGILSSSAVSFATYTASQETINSGYNTFTASADGRLNNIELTTASLETEINGLNVFTSSIQNEVNVLSSFTGSYATTGSNRFIGIETIDGELIISQSATTTGSIIHFPVLSSQGDQGTVASRFYNPGGPSLFDYNVSGVDKFDLRAAGLAEMQISSGTSMVLNAGESGNGNLVSTKIMVQQDQAPGVGAEKLSITVGNATSAGRSYPIARQLFGDYSNFSGNLYKDYFGTEVFASGYAYGAEQTINGQGINQSVIASGSGGSNKSSLQILDNYNGTSQVQITSPTKVLLNGKVHVNASVETTVGTVGISATTASIDFSAVPLWELTLASGVDTHLNAVNVLPGQSLNILVTQNAGTAGTLSFSPTFLQPSGSAYTPSTVLGSKDILTLLTFNDTSKVYVAAVNTLI